MRKTVLRVIPVVAITLAWGTAHAAHVVYSPDIDQGELAVEVRGHHVFDDREEIDGSQQIKLEVEYAPTSWWRTEAVVEWEKEADESLEATEVAWDNVFRLTREEAPVDLGLVLEYVHSLEDDGEDALELGLLAEKDFTSSVLTGNLIFEREFEGGAETEIEYAARYRWRLSEALEPGIEVHGELGDWGENGSFDDQVHELGPSLLGKLADEWKYEVAVLFGVTDASPAATLRLMFEFEFE